MRIFKQFIGWLLKRHEPGPYRFIAGQRSVTTGFCSEPGCAMKTTSRQTDVGGGLWYCEKHFEKYMRIYLGPHGVIARGILRNK